MSNHPQRSKGSPCRIPSVAEVMQAQFEARLSDAQCAELVCVSEGTWRAWSSGERRMPAGAWKLFRYGVGLLKLPSA